MKRIFSIAVLGLLSAVPQAAAGDLVAAPALPGLHAKVVDEILGPVTLDYVTGEVHQGRVVAEGPVMVYNNIDPGSDQAIGLGGTANVPFGDDMVLVPGGGLLDTYDFSIFNASNAGNLNTCTLTVNFLDYDLGLIGQVTVNLNMTVLFGAPLGPGQAGLLTLSNLSGSGVNLPRYVVSELAYTNIVGGATDISQISYYPALTGWSYSSFYSAGQWFVYTGQNNPADFYQAVTVVPAAGNELLWTTGAPEPVFFNAANTILGYISGNNTGTPQRWAAIPFSLANDATIQQISTYWFVDATQPGTEPDNINYIIWDRTGLAAPVNGDQVSSGTLSALDTGNGPATNFHLYSVNISLSAGDYYLTIYGDGGTAPNWIGWITGGDKQAESVEQAFMWRSSSFPTPGFVAYNPGTIAPGPQMTDSDDLWNIAFALWGTTANCDCAGDGNGFGQSDLALLLSCYNAGPCCDIDGSNDGITDQADLAAGLSVYNLGTCP